MNILHRPRVAHALAVMTAAYLVYYLVWRASETLNPAALAFSLVLLAADAQGIVSFFLFAFMTWNLETRPPFRLAAGLTVDVFMPTFNEPVEVLEATLTGCAGITYPHTTYVLDDGRRPEVEALAARLGCRYLTRPDNRHAKAGNLNAALARTGGEFIVILDADTVPQPDYLDRTLGYFVDERVALVQLPQEFYNLDSVQHVTGESTSSVWHEQTLFYRVIQPGKNRWNAAFWCGSPSVVRRAALDSVGGVATETVTEDIHTTIRLHGRGWKTIFHDEVLAYGIAPQTLEAFAIQRLRWAQGAMQLLRSRENPLIAPGLTLAQRLNYVASMGTYFDAFQKLVYVLTPAMILLTGALPLRVDAVSFLLHWAPYMLLGMLANMALGRGYFRYLRVEEYNLLKMFTFAWAATILVWPRPLRFRVTPKAVKGGVALRERRQVAPNLAVLGFVALSMVIGAANLLWRLFGAHQDRGIAVATMFWATVTGAVLAFGIVDVLRRFHQRSSYRFPTRIPATISAKRGARGPATVYDLSRHGAGLLTSADLRPGARVSTTLRLPDGPVTVSARVAHLRTLPNGQRIVGIRFRSLEDASARRLLAFLFVTLPRRLQDAEEARPSRADLVLTGRQAGAAS